MLSRFMNIKNLLVISGILIFSFTAIWNVGFIAIDDYVELISKTLPAQEVNAKNIIGTSGIRPPIPQLILYSLTSLGLKIGFEHPLNQFRFALFCLGMFSFLMHYLSIHLIFKNKKKIEIALFFLSFYFVSPLFLTRAMFETMAMPYFSFSASLFSLYFLTSKISFLVYSMVFLSISSILRFQTGIPVLAILFIILIKKKYHHLLIFFLLGSALFLLTGLFDFFFKNGFHNTLFSYVKFNILNQNQFPFSPFYTYTLLFIGLSLPPAFFAKYRGFNWKEEYYPLIPLLMFFAIFLIAHTLVPHKEDRFMLPLLFIFMMLLVPLFNYIINNNLKWRRNYFLILNGILLILTCVYIPQYNAVGPALFLNKNSHIKKVVYLEDSLGFLPTVFLKNKVKFVNIKAKDLSTLNYNEFLLVSKKKEPLIEPIRNKLIHIKDFKPGIFEKLAIIFNPSHNSRRDRVSLYKTFPNEI